MHTRLHNYYIKCTHAFINLGKGLGKVIYIFGWKMRWLPATMYYTIHAHHGLSRARVH